jgi:hypothetical protein
MFRLVKQNKYETTKPDSKRIGFFVFISLGGRDGYAVDCKSTLRGFKSLPKLKNDWVAQLAERLIVTQMVGGSSPSLVTNILV